MARKVLDDNGVLYLWNKIKAKFVEQEDGKGLSANNYTDAEKTKLAGIEVHANYYKHPTGAGYSHIPVGGSSGQILRWSAAGTAEWGADKDTTYTAATTTSDGLMSAADKTKLNGITTGANKYTHPTYTAYTSGLYKVTVNNTGHVSAATVVGKDDITALGIPAQDTTYTAASQVKMGLLTAADKTKLDGIANGAEVNQNAFSTVQVGNSGEFTFSATSKEDKLTITAGTGVTITMDRERKVISINAHAHSNKETLDAITADLWTQLTTQSHTHSNKTVLDATTASFTTALLTKLNGIATGANKTTVDAALSGTSTNPVQNKAVNTALAGKLNASARGAKNGVASLDADGRVPSSQLPSYVDDVIEGYYYNEKFYQEEAHTTEITGEGGKIYVDVSTNLSYRYSGSTYVQITSSDMVAITNAEIDAICV
nr:MAG TPA: Peptidase [Caudoviricetes sp.]